MAKLVVLTEGFAGTSHELKGERTTVGRMEDNAFQVVEPSVSSHHCEILLRGNEVVVKDLGSTNGTYINGQQVKESPLRSGQILRVGQVEMRLESGAGGTPAAKRQLDHTAPVPAGVKLTELEQGGARVMGSPFAKKSDKAGKMFLYVGIGLAVVILILIVYSITQVGH